MDMKKFSIVTYINPAPEEFDMFKKSLDSVMSIKYLDRVCISFVQKLDKKHIKELNKYDNLVWRDGMDYFWAEEMIRLIEENDSEYYFIWEEDTNIFDAEQFEKAFEKMVKNKIEFLLTQDLKWIKRAQYLLENGLAVQKGDYIYFNWGTEYAKYCRKMSDDKLVNGAYPVTVNGVFTKDLLLSLLKNLTSSDYWERITKGNYSHFHHNPRLPHSFEVYPGFWWEGKYDEYGEVAFQTMIGEKQFAEELGERLVNKITQKQKQWKA